MLGWGTGAFVIEEIGEDSGLIWRGLGCGVYDYSCML